MRKLAQPPSSWRFGLVWDWKPLILVRGVSVGKPGAGPSSNIDSVVQRQLVVFPFWATTRSKGGHLFPGPLGN